MEKKKREFFTINRTLKDLLFYIVLIAFPLAQFIVFYIVVNFNSILLAFQTVDLTTGTVEWNVFGNFQAVFEDFFNQYALKKAVENSVLVFFVGFFITTPLSLLFSFYLFKRNLCYGFFRVMLFLPSIVSSVVMVLMYQFFVESAVPTIIYDLFQKYIPGLIENVDTRFVTIIFYNIFMGFGMSTILYNDAMNSIAPEIIESAQIDGAVGLREFWHIIMPSIWPTFGTFLTVGVAGIFTNQFCLYSFFSEYASPEVSTLGYWMYVKTLAAQGSRSEYSYLAAMGVILTLFTIPLVFVLRKLITKYGPKED